jgi:hypothetical protein
MSGTPNRANTATSFPFVRRAAPSLKNALNEPLYFLFGFFYMILEM